MKRLRSILVCLVVLAVMVVVPCPVLGHGYGFYTSIGTGTFVGGESEGDHRQVALGLILDSNVSTDRILHYRGSLGLTWNRFENVMADDTNYWYWWMEQQPENRPFDTEGWGVEMVHSFGLGRFRTERHNFWLGPSTRIHYEMYRSGNPGPWIMRKYGVGVIAGAAFHVSERRTVTVTASVHELETVSEMDFDGSEMLFTLQVDILHTKERTAEVRAREQREREQRRMRELEERALTASFIKQFIDDEFHHQMTGDSTEKDPTIQTGHTPPLFSSDTRSWTPLKQSCGDCRTFVIDTFPAVVEILVDDRVFAKKDRRLIITDVPDGQHDIRVRWPHRMLTVPLSTTARKVYCMCNGLTGQTLVEDVFADRFIGVGSGYFTDIDTGLQWADGEIIRSQSWMATNDSCISLRSLGKDDWRLPTVDEMKRLATVLAVLQNTESLGVAGKPTLPLIPEGRYWTSTKSVQTSIRPVTTTEFITIPEGRQDRSDHMRQYNGIPVRWHLELLNPLKELTASTTLDVSPFTRRSTEDSADTQGPLDAVDEHSLTTMLVESAVPLLVLFTDAEIEGEGDSQISSIGHVLSDIYGDFVRIVHFPLPSERMETLKRYHEIGNTPCFALYVPEGTRLSRIGLVSDVTLPMTPQRLRQITIQIAAWIWAAAIEPDCGIFIQGKSRSLTWDRDTLKLHDGILPAP